MKSGSGAPPRGLHVQREGDVLRISRRWVSLYGLVAGPMGVVLVVAGVMRAVMPPPAGTDLWLRYGLPPALIVAGAACLYAALVGLVNRTTITIGPDHVTVEHGPLPWIGPQPLRGAALRTIELHEERAGGFFGSGRVCRLEATLMDDSTVTLDTIHDNASQARWIIRALQSHTSTSDTGL